MWVNIQTDILKYHGVDVTSVAEGIDAAQPIGRQMFALTGMQAEQFLVGLRDKVYRGQEGRVIKGLNPGGKCYGYRNVPIEDPSRTMKYGRPAVLVFGWKLSMSRRKSSSGFSSCGRMVPATAKLHGNSTARVSGPRHAHWSRYSIFEIEREVSTGSFVPEGQVGARRDRSIRGMVTWITLHDLALEVARQTLAPDPEFPELIGLARELLKTNIENSH